MLLAIQITARTERERWALRFAYRRNRILIFFLFYKNYSKYVKWYRWDIAYSTLYRRRKKKTKQKRATNVQNRQTKNERNKITTNVKRIHHYFILDFQWDAVYLCRCFFFFFFIQPLIFVIVKHFDLFDIHLLWPLFVAFMRFPIA